MEHENGQLVFSFTWLIKNFTSCKLNNKEYIESPEFTAENLSGSVWFIRLYPRGWRTNVKDRLSSFLTRSGFDVCEKDLIIDFEIKILVGHNNFLMASFQVIDCKFEKFRNLGERNLIETEKLIDYMHSIGDDTLKIRCDLKSKEVVKKEAVAISDIKFGLNSYIFDSLKWKLEFPNSSDWSQSKIFFFSEEQKAIEIILTSSEESFLFHIHKLGTNWEYRLAFCRVFLVNILNENCYDCISVHQLESKITNDPCQFSTSSIKKSLLDMKSLFVKNGFFKLTIELMRQKKCLLEPNSIAASDTFSPLYDDFCSMFISKKYTDVEFRIGTNTFPAHRSVLAARSAVLAAMFEQDMLESQTGVIDVCDCDSKTLNSFLEFLYTGIVTDMDYKNASNLLIIAEKYQVLSLKEKCSAFLMLNVDEKNVCGILYIADLVGCENLKESAMIYIKKHAGEILLSPEWNEWSEKNIKLGFQVLSKLSLEFGTVLTKVTTK